VYCLVKDAQAVTPAAEKTMKFLLLAIIAIAYVICQPATDPTNSGCKPSYTCIAEGAGTCGNATNGIDTTKYCGNTNDFCDSKTTGNCIARKAVGAACNYTNYFGGDCVTGSCVNSTCQPVATTTTTPAPTFTYVYENGDCTTGICHGSLHCVANKCQKYYSVAVGGTCVNSNDCAPGNLCLSSTCTAQTGTLVGAACTANTGCSTQVSSVCVCNSPNQATSGSCASSDPNNLSVFSAAGVTACASLTKQYTNYATITATNAPTAYTYFGCVGTCALLNGGSAIYTAWQGYNHVVYGTGCTYTAPTACGNPTTTGATTAAKTGSASGIFASLFLTFLALFF